ncbi:hypothetical protein [Streptomyces sp. NPDC058308]|uniref:hypothetical protein n=1 Tax=Streptomyces sp. NPDC058308 TaxID=3346440 RepID=UPI0036E5FF8B
MVILDAVADRWGGCAIGEGSYGPGGKTMWFELALPTGGSGPGSKGVQRSRELGVGLGGLSPGA